MSWQSSVSPSFKMAGQENDEFEDELEADVLQEEDILKVCDEAIGEDNGLCEALTDMDVTVSASLTEAGSEGEVNDDSMSTFSQHKGSVFSVCIHPQEKIACSGSEDDTAYVWNTETSSILFKCDGHKDSVICTSFSYNGTHLATGDMSGLIQVWKTETQQCTWKADVDEVEWIAWHPSATVLLAGTAVGDIWMWRIPYGDCKVFPGHGLAVTSGTILSDGQRILCGYADGAVKIWDLKVASSVVSWSGQGHSLHASQVNCVAAHENGHLGISGSADSSAKLFNCSTGKIICDLQAESIRESVESAAFCRSVPLAAVGSLDGAIGIWDVSVGILREICHVEAGIVKIIWSQGTAMLYSASLDGLIHLWDGRTAKRERTWSGHTDSILDVALNEELAILVSCSDDHSCKVFQV